MKTAHITLLRIVYCLPLLMLILFVSFPRNLPGSELVELQPYFRTITLTGFTYPLQEMTITSEVSGRCLEIFADIGDAVPANGRLAEIDPTFIKLDLEANTIARDQAARQLAQEEKTLARYTTLLSQKSTPQARLDEVSLAADLHRLTLRKLKNEEVRLREQLARHTLSAPTGWQAIERYANPGEFIQAGKPVAKLGDFRSLLIPLAVTYDEMQSLTRMQDIKLYLPDLMTKASGRIYRTSPIFDATTRKIKMELLLDANQKTTAEPLHGGMRVELKFISDEDTRSFRVPHSALINRYEASWLIQPDGNRVQVIFLGSSEDNQYAIVSGKDLAAGQQVLTHPENYKQQ